MLGGHTVHVGSHDSYLAVYSTGRHSSGSSAARGGIGRLNHVGVVVDDLDAVEQLVLAEGLTPHTHGDYEPGRRFYFDDPDDIEFEIVSYADVNAPVAAAGGRSGRQF